MNFELVTFTATCPIGLLDQVSGRVEMSRDPPPVMFDIPGMSNLVAFGPPGIFEGILFKSATSLVIH